MLEIWASICIQGSAIGPASFVVAAADLCCLTLGNNLCKYADNTCIIIPASNVHSRAAEINNVESWARINNLHLNCTKCAEIIFTSSRRARSAASLPPTLPDIARLSSLKILGVTISSRLSVSDHVRRMSSLPPRTLHALRQLRAHGLGDAALQTVYQAVVDARLLFASSA